MPKFKPKKRLHGLEAGEISLVPEGANGKRFLIYKNAEGKMPQHAQLLDMIAKADPEVMARVDEALKAHTAQHGSQVVMDQPAAAPLQKDNIDDVAQENELRAVTSPLDEHSHAALKAVVRILSPFRERLPAGLVHSVLDAAGFSEAEEPNEAGDLYNNAPGATRAGEGYQELDPAASVDPANSIEPKAGSSDAADANMNKDQEDAMQLMMGGVQKNHFEEAIAKAQCVYKEHMEKLGYRNYPETGMVSKNTKPKGEPVSKSADSALDLSKVQDPETRQAVEAVFKSRKELVEKNADLEKKLAERDDADRKKEIVQKAASFTNVALPQEDIVACLEDAHKLSPEAYERVCKSFATLNNQGRASSLFGEIGSSQPAGGQSTEDAWAKIEKMAEGVVQKSTDKMSKEAAIEIVLNSDEGQRLYSQHQSGRKGGV